jgi:hypothetical protein
MVSNFWRRLWGWFGVNFPAVETVGAAVQVADPAVPVPETAAVTPWVVGFESVLPAMSGAVLVPASLGYRLAVYPFDAVSLGDLLGKFWKMVELRQEWAGFETGRPFAGYMVLAGPGWELSVFFENAPERVEWYAGSGAAGANAAGAARPEQFLQALFLWPDGAAVVGWLRANAFRPPDYGAVV